MDTRFYRKTTADAPALSYASDGEGKIVQNFVKVFTISVQIGDGANKAIPLLDPKGSKVQSYIAQLRTDAGVIVGGNHTYALNADTNVLTVTAAGANIAANSVLTLYYTVG
jgi:hypothetical protein